MIDGTLVVGLSETNNKQQQQENLFLSLSLSFVHKEIFKRRKIIPFDPQVRLK